MLYLVGSKVNAIDILILSNGPGELATWVKPVVQELRRQLGDDRDRVRISIVLSPCPHASGREATIARSYPEIDRVQAADHFFPFLLWGKTSGNWDWWERGIVIFLGGDQFYPAIIGKRLGYRTLVYAEWEARWHGWIDHFAVMRPEIATRAKPQSAHKFTVVGDLIAEVGRGGGEGNGGDGEASGLKAGRSRAEAPLLAFLPGSKPSKLAQGVPFMLAIAELIHVAHPESHFVIPVAPALPLETLARFADRHHNPILSDLGNITAELVVSPNADQPAYLKTSHGVKIDLYTQSPAYDLLTQCQLCITTVGANTAELGALAIPMIVLLPIQRLDAVPLDGISGLFTRLPGINTLVIQLLYWWAKRQNRFFAWPNLWANAAIVPELVGHLSPQQVADLALDLLNHPSKLQQMRDRLRQVRGESGAAVKLVRLVRELVGEGGEGGTG
ncbi:MAG: lipid-A-disaccharide synthase [Scytolyngbya sp. HA4215-MV1]|jgi:lipid-A-disaccharide synthase|nr:lipid-A-disaccharide synthase [Scytolyngbya sp. HA4215-MV1]